MIESDLKTWSEDDKLRIKGSANWFWRRMLSWWKKMCVGPFLTGCGPNIQNSENWIKVIQVVMQDRLRLPWSRDQSLFGKLKSGTVKQTIGSGGLDVKLFVFTAF